MSKHPGKAQPAIEKLKSNKGLTPLLARLRLHQELLAAVRRQLPETMQSHCLACVLDTQGRVTLYVDTAAWASQIRFYQTSLLPALKKIASAERLRLRVLLPVDPVTRNAPPPRVPNHHILAQLEHNARFVTDPVIRQALKRMVHAMKTSRQKG